MKGEFENRLRQVIDEVQASPKPIILFVDEAHTLIGAGGAAGTGDAANLLKPALARGTLRTIAATTWAEYKKYIEKDPALTRRFQVVKVEEPSEDKAILMVRGVASDSREASPRAGARRGARSGRAAVASLHPGAAAARQGGQPARHRLRARGHQPARRAAAARGLPADDRGAADRAGDHRPRGSRRHQRRRAAKGGGREAGGERERARLARRAVERRARAGGAASSAFARSCGKGSEPVEGTGSKLEQAAEAQKTAADAAGGRRGDAGGAADDCSASCAELQTKLSELQGESPLILPSVDEQAVGSVVQDWTGVPVGRMVKNEIETVLNLADALNQRVIGQRHALEMIAKRIQTSRAKLDNPNKPIGVFMLCGPSGVGKTETALTLAEALYGGEQNVITINMSEFQEAHTVSTLKGSPPGYVGYGEGGVLTEAVRRRPYSVVLLDEVEKAHSDVHELFFQVFDKGWMEDGEGRRIDFRNTIILLTSNVGTELIMSMCKDPELMPEPEGIAKGLREPLLKKFPAALLGRLVVIPYYPLSDEMLANIVRLQLGRIAKRVVEHHKIPFNYDDEAVKLIVSRCTEVESGGRMIDAILTNTVLPAISREFLTRTMAGAALNGVRLAVADGDFAYRFE